MPLFILREQEEATAAREAAAAARSNAEQAAESIRLKALAEAQAKSVSDGQLLIIDCKPYNELLN
jgi:hypothetical protein